MFVRTCVKNVFNSPLSPLCMCFARILHYWVLKIGVVNKQVGWHKHDSQFSKLCKHFKLFGVRFINFVLVFDFFFQKNCSRYDLFLFFCQCFIIPKGLKMSRFRSLICSVLVCQSCHWFYLTWLRNFDCKFFRIFFIFNMKLLKA